jgi:hypothetical protein
MGVCKSFQKSTSEKEEAGEDFKIKSGRVLTCLCVV